MKVKKLIIIFILLLFSIMFIRTEYTHSQEELLEKQKLITDRLRVEKKYFVYWGTDSLKRGDNYYYKVFGEK